MNTEISVRSMKFYIELKVINTIKKHPNFSNEDFALMGNIAALSISISEEKCDIIMNNPEIFGYKFTVEYNSNTSPCCIIWGFENEDDLTIFELL